MRVGLAEPTLQIGPSDQHQLPSIHIDKMERKVLPKDLNH